MVPPTPDTCYMQLYQSRPKVFLRSKRKRIATIMPARCNEQPTNQHQNKTNGRGAFEQKILAWRPVRVLAATMHSLAAPYLFINRIEVDRPPCGSKQRHDHLNINKIIKSAPWDIKHVVTRLEPLRVLRTPRNRYHCAPRPTGSISTRLVSKLNLSTMSAFRLQPRGASPTWGRETMYHFYE